MTDEARVQAIRHRLEFLAETLQTRWITQRASDDSARPMLELDIPAREVDAVITVMREAAAELAAADARAASAEQREREVTDEKHAAYHERNQLVAVLSKLWPSHWANHPEDDLTWDDEWRTIICIHSPVGQLTWHIKLSEQGLFTHLPKGANHWDGHTTEQKYQRLASL